MSRKFLSASKLNELAERVEYELQITPFTHRAGFKQSFPTLIDVNTGKVRTYAQAKEYRMENAERYGQKAVNYSKADYTKGLKDLYETAGKRTTIEGEKEHFIDSVRGLMKEYNAHTGASLNIETMPFEDLREAVNHATEMVGKRAKERNDSPHMFYYIRQYLEQQGYRNIGHITETMENYVKNA